MTATGLLAPVFSGAFQTERVQDNEDDVCELMEGEFSHVVRGETMPRTEVGEQDWWVCPGQQIADNCRTVYYDGEYTVACAY